MGAAAHPPAHVLCTVFRTKFFHASITIVIGQTGQGGSNYHNTQVGRPTRDRAVQKCARVMIVDADVSSHNVLNRLILV